MAATEAQVKTQIQNLVKIYDQLRLFAGVNATNFIGMHTTLISSAVGDYVPDLLARFQSTRTRIDAALRDYGSPLEPLLREYAIALGFTEVDSQSIMTRLYDDAVTNAKRVQSRGYVFGAIAANGANVGTGIINRLNVDENGFVLENQHAELKTARCLFDSTSGAQGRNEEIFEVRGANAAVDSLLLGGSGARVQVSALSARAGASLVQNPSFSLFSGTAAVPTAITSWTSSITVNAANYQFLTDTTQVASTNIYRDFPGDSTPYSLQCLANAWSIAQNLETNRASFAPGVPYYLQVAYRKSTNGTDGSLTMTLGAQSATVADLTTVANTNWNILRMPIGKANWYKNFDQAGLTLTIARAGGTTGTMQIDDIILSPYASFDGSWYAIVGTQTQFKRFDQFTWTDVEYGAAILQNWFWRSLGRYYPAAPANATTAPSAALAGAGAGNVDNGTHVYTYTFVDANGVESGPSAASASVNVVDKTVNGKVSVTGVLAGTANQITKRNIYRSKAGTATPLFLLTTISDNATTTYTDNTADASLPATQAPAGVTWADPT